MKAQIRTRTILQALAVLAILTISGAASAEIGTAFTYQGALKSGGEAMDGTANMEFRIYDVPTLGIPLSAPIAINSVPVHDGVFTVELDFGQLPSDNEDRWLEITVNSTVLAPRQKLTPAPLAQRAMVNPLVFGGQIHESPYWADGSGGAFASPMGTNEAVYAEARAQMIMPTACTAKNLYVRNSSIADYPNTTVTVRVNGSDTALSCSQTSGNGPTCSNVSDAITINAGDRVSMRFMPNLPARAVGNSEVEIRAFVAFGWICD